jgi:hypothetical protein
VRARVREALLADERHIGRTHRLAVGVAYHEPRLDDHLAQILAYLLLIKRQLGCDPLRDAPVFESCGHRFHRLSANEFARLTVGAQLPELVGGDACVCRRERRHAITVRMIPEGVGYLWGVQVAIIGLGGIGASVGLAIQHEALGWGVVGYDVAPDALTGALQMGAIDHPAESVAACACADLIVIATPPLAMPEVFQQLAPRLRPETALTDVASVKSPVLRWAEAYLPYPSRFVGGHPIAGTERHGVRAARADLFHGAPWALTPTAQTDPDALQRVEAFVRPCAPRR